MKRIDLERHLREQGCVLYREGGGHSVWLNPALRKIASIPRHREIKEGTVRDTNILVYAALCRRLPEFIPYQ